MHACKLGNESGGSVYVDGELADWWTNANITEGTVDLVTINATQTMSAGTTYEVKIIASDNTQVSFSVKAD